MSSEYTVSINNDAIIKKLEQLLDDDTKLQIQSAFAEAIDPWTPFLTGQLSHDIIIDKDGVEYTVPYAAEKYFGTVYHKEVHPLATSYWDEVAMQQGALEPLTEEVKAILIAKANELYG